MRMRPFESRNECPNHTSPRGGETFSFWTLQADQLAKETLCRGDFRRTVANIVLTIKRSPVTAYEETKECEMNVGGLNITLQWKPFSCLLYQGR